jgi:hypothetical protein
MPFTSLSKMPVEVQAMFSDGGQVVLTPEFRTALSASLFPVVIPFLGYCRQGKSIRLNQVLTRTLQSTSPFEVRAGSESVTLGFMFCGSIPLRALCSKHSVDFALAPERDADVFFIDCEGMDHLDGTSQGYGQVLLALTQISTITVFVHGRLLSGNDIQRISSLLSMTRFVGQASEQMETGFASFEARIGVQVDDGISDTSPEYETVRKANDEAHRQKIHRWLTSYGVPCSLANSCSLVQPNFDQENGYWASIKDFVTFVRGIVGRTAIVPGSILVGVFDESAKLASGRGLSGQSFDDVFRHALEKWFVTVREEVRPMADTCVRRPIKSMNLDQLKRLQEQNFTDGAIRTMTAQFRTKCEKVYPRSVTTFAQLYTGFENSLKEEVRKTVREVYFNQCFTVVLPNEMEVIATSIAAGARSTLWGLSPQQFENFGVAKLSNSLQNDAKTRLQDTARGMNADLLKDNRFTEKVDQLRQKVQKLATDLDAARQVEHNQWKAAEERRKKEAEAKKRRDEEERMKRQAEQQEAGRQRKLKELQYEATRSHNYMQIMVRVNSGRHITLEVEPTDRIECVRKKIEAKDGTPAAQQLLTYQGHPLEDGNTLLNYAVPANATLQMVHRLRGGMEKCATQFRGNRIRRAADLGD